MGEEFPRYLTPDQAADLLPRFDASWIRSRCKSGELRASFVGNRWLIKLDDLEAFLEAHVAQPAPLTRRRRRRDLSAMDRMDRMSYRQRQYYGR
jgi:excisionase family DNA binding protein